MGESSHVSIVRTTWLNPVTTVHAEPRLLFRVLVVYEDFAAGRRANDTCSFLMTQLGDWFELQSGLWKFESLRNPQLAEIAAAEALVADVIIVAARGSGPLAAEITSWIDKWLPRRGDRSGALIALIGGSLNSEQSPPSAYAYLQKVAATAKMDFLPQVLTIADRQSPSSESPPTPEMNSARWDELMQQPKPERHWGINE